MSSATSMEQLALQIAPTPLARTWGYVFCFGSLLLWEVSLGAAVTGGDLALGTGIALLWLGRDRARRWVAPHWTVALALFIVAAWLSATVATLLPHGWFSLSAFTTSIVRLVYVLLAAVVVWNSAVEDRAVVGSVIRGLTIGHALYGMGMWLGAQVLGPSSIFAVGVHYRPTFLGDVARVQGLMSEPANFGTLLALGLPWVLGAGRHVTVWTMATLLAIGLSFSPTGMGVAAIIFAAALWGRGGRGIAVRSRRDRARYRRLVAVGALGAILLVAAPTESTLRASSVGRVTKLLAGDDRSGQLRLLGSWTPAVIAVSQQPFQGASPGNAGNLALDLQPDLRAMGVSAERYSWNSFAWALGSAGILGMILWLAMIGLIGRVSKLGAVAAVAWMFASSAVQQPTIWLFLAAFTAIPYEGTPATRSQHDG